MRSQLGAGIDRQFESAAIGEIRLCSHFGNQAYQSGRCFLYGIFHPRPGQEKIYDAGAIERCSLTRPLSNPQILRQNRPAAFAIEFSDPVDVRDIGWEFVAQGDNLMIDEKRRQRRG